jgi:hypothetical protein
MKEEVKNKIKKAVSKANKGKIRNKDGKNAIVSINMSFIDIVKKCVGLKVKKV